MEVAVKRRVLWIGMEAYPLQNIARASAVMYTADRAAAVAQFLKRMVALGLFAAFWSWILGALSASTLRTLALALFGLIATVALVRMVRVLVQKTFYALIIETAGAPHTALVSWSNAEVQRLVHMIMDAISNPNAEFAIHIAKLHVGDRITQYGNYNTGKAGA
ncbi:DUF6232 family protein (plasmid) [Streptomyces poriferorum]|uniref:DUF6232 family protein n=1 Tax=Streptomyces poriferorum TaxID=2798799 RepID=UPI00273F17C4|nr:DUF6232 family protein [Streptomyces sp. Alt1]WLQ53940.1 DUF6232 family protein [Streptomyces sp. Alt1]